MGPWPDAELREDSHMLDIWFNDEQGRTAAVVVPTRMHEPGFYVRSPDGEQPYWNLRSEDDLARFRQLVDAGTVTRRDAQPAGEPAVEDLVAADMAGALTFRCMGCGVRVGEDHEPDCEEVAPA